MMGVLVFFQGRSDPAPRAARKEGYVVLRKPLPCPNRFGLPGFRRHTLFAAGKQPCDGPKAVAFAPANDVRSAAVVKDRSAWCVSQWIGNRQP